MEGMRKISVLSRTITHAALPSCRVFLGVEHEIFNQTKVKTFVQSVGLILVRLGLQSAAGRRWERERVITTGTSRRTEPRTCRAPRPPRWRAWRWRTCPGSPCWKGKNCYSQIRPLRHDLRKRLAGRKKGNLASGLLVVVSAVLSLYVVQDYIGTATTQWRSESDMTKVELKSDKRFLDWRK